MSALLNEYQAQEIDFARRFYQAWHMGGEAAALRFASRHMLASKAKPDRYVDKAWLGQRGYEIRNGKCVKQPPALPFAA